MLKLLFANLIPDNILDLRMKSIQRKVFAKENGELLALQKEGKFLEEIKYLFSKKCFCSIPYEDVHSKYCINDIIVKYDEDFFPYVMHKLVGSEEYARLYFPQYSRKRTVKLLYYSLITEQDAQSPHCYFDEMHKLNSESILFDIGSAEGIVALAYINCIKGAILFEGAEEWIEPLRRTFAPFKDKVAIVDKYVSDEDTDNTVNLKSYMDSCGGRPFMKMDIEGMEMEVLESIENELRNSNIDASICTYHREDDAKRVEEFFRRLNYQTRFTKRHFCVKMYSEKYQFRKCVLYAES